MYVAIAARTLASLYAWSRSWASEARLSVFGVGGWVWGVGCGVWRVVCGVWCVVCGVWCVVCGVWCVVCGVLGLGSRFSVFGLGVQGSGFRAYLVGLVDGDHDVLLSLGWLGREASVLQLDGARAIFARLVQEVQPLEHFALRDRTVAARAEPLDHEQRERLVLDHEEDHVVRVLGERDFDAVERDERLAGLVWDLRLRGQGLGLRV